MRSVGVKCVQDQIYTSTDAAVLLDEIRNCQDVLNKITDMKLGRLGTALITITNQVCHRRHHVYCMITTGVGSAVWGRLMLFLHVAVQCDFSYSYKYLPVTVTFRSHTFDDRDFCCGHYGPRLMNLIQLQNLPYCVK